MKAVTQESVGEPLRRQLADNPVLLQRKNILLGGGSVWAAITFMRPETALEPFPKVQSADLKAYADLLAKAPGTYPIVGFSKIADPAAQMAAQADYDRICGVSGGKPIFTPEELQAGASLLNEVADSLEFDTKAVYFDRKAVTAWVTAYITPLELRDSIPSALGRELPDLLRERFSPGKL